MVNKLFKALYIDKFTIYRSQNVDDGYGGTISKEVLISENNPCRLSQRTLGATGGDTNITSLQEFKLFIPLEIKILQNDKLEIFRGNTKYTARATQPFEYIDVLPHQELILQEVIENGY